MEKDGEERAAMLVEGKGGLSRTTINYLREPRKVHLGGLPFESRRGLWMEEVASTLLQGLAGRDVAEDL